MKVSYMQVGWLVVAVQTGQLANTGIGCVGGLQRTAAPCGVSGKRVSHNVSHIQEPRLECTGGSRSFQMSLGH